MDTEVPSPQDDRLRLPAPTASKAVGVALAHGTPALGHPGPDLKALQAAIYADKVRRARSMTPSERFDEAMELANDIYGWMLDGARAQCQLESDDEAWAEVARRLQVLRRLHEHKLYKPVAA